MKKFLSTFLAVLTVAIVLVACGGNENPPVNPPVDPNDTTETPGEDTIVTPPTMAELIIGSWVCDSCTITMGDKVQDGPMVGAEFTFDADGNLDLSGDAQTYTLQDSTIIFQSSQGMSTEYLISELTETRLTFFKESGPARLTVSCGRKTEE